MSENDSIPKLDDKVDCYIWGYQTGKEPMLKGPYPAVIFGIRLERIENQFYIDVAILRGLSLGIQHGLPLYFSHERPSDSIFCVPQGASLSKNQ